MQRNDETKSGGRGSGGAAESAAGLGGTRDASLQEGPGAGARAGEPLPGPEAGPGPTEGTAGPGAAAGAAAGTGGGPGPGPSPGSGAGARPAKPRPYRVHKRRTTRACEVCHDRKVRCDAFIRVPCSSCQAFGLVCRLREKRTRGSGAASAAAGVLGDGPPVTPSPPSDDPAARWSELGGSNAPGANAGAGGLGPGGLAGGPAGAPPGAPPGAAVAASAAPAAAGTAALPRTASGGLELAADPRSGKPAPADPRTGTSRADARVRDAVSNGVAFGEEYLLTRGVQEPGEFFDAQREDRERVFVYFGPSSFLGLLTGAAFGDGSHFANAEKLASALPLGGAGTPRIANVEMLRISGAFLLPAKQICDALVDTYFARVHALMPIIDQTEFRAQYAAHCCSMFLLQSMLCVAVKLAEQPWLRAQLRDARGSRDLAATIFYQRAKALYDGRYEQNEMALLQGMLLLSRQGFHEKNTIQMPMYFIKAAVSVAQTYGMHRAAERHPTFTPNEMRLRKLVWWQLYVLDTVVSVAIGRPQAINLDDCDVPVLTHSDFEFEGGLPEHAPPLANRDCVICTVQIAEIMSRVARELARHESERPRAALVARFDVLLQRWRQDLPETLAYRTNAEIFTQHSLPKAFVNALYYKTLCLLHKGNIHAPGTEGTEGNAAQHNSAGIAFQAAHSLTLIGQILLDRGEVGYCYVSHAYCFFEAMIILVHRMYDPGSPYRDVAVACYQVLDKVLARFGELWNSCELLRDVLYKFTQNPAYLRSVVQKFKDRVGADEAPPQLPLEVEWEPSAVVPASVPAGMAPQAPQVPQAPPQYPVFPHMAAPFPPAPFAPVQFAPALQHMQAPPAAVPAGPPALAPAPPFNFMTTDVLSASASSQQFDPRLLFPDVSEPLPADFKFSGRQSLWHSPASDQEVFQQTQQEPLPYTAHMPNASSPVQPTSIPLPPEFWDSVKVNFTFFDEPHRQPLWADSGRQDDADHRDPNPGDADLRDPDHGDAGASGY
ncbi:LAMI_0D05402g1_1 [Lachancea mirantina]|uniref:LAMI_0D05402g1_1 n=1 Tax=Lachancea mirantina TaxID=1230905 RepID=A0A1G4JB41_9SACH|nr:LAMI_0D05402g1_1 [Lachancea mirantina]